MERERIDYITVHITNHPTAFESINDGLFACVEKSELEISYLPKWMMEAVENYYSSPHRLYWLQFLIFISSFEPVLLSVMKIVWHMSSCHWYQLFIKPLDFLFFRFRKGVRVFVLYAAAGNNWDHRQWVTTYSEFTNLNIKVNHVDWIALAAR